MSRRLLVGAVVIAVAAVVLLARGSTQPVQASDEVPPLAVIAKRVERLRGLEFRSLPKVKRVTAREFHHTIQREVDRFSAAERRRARSEQDLLKLLGFESRRATPADLGDTSGILGLYDPPSHTLTIVTDAQGSRWQRELTYAHELTHALEDQHFGLPRFLRGGDDAAVARRALVEGSARETEVAYAYRYLGRATSGRELAQRLPASTYHGSINYFLNSDRFAYLDGARYVARLLREGGQRTRDRAFRHPPATTEAVLHPPRTPAPEPARLRVARVAAGFHRVEKGTMGEFDTSQMLLFGARVGPTASRDAAHGAAGWAGGRYELWRAGSRGIAGCSRPCVERDLLAIRWRFDDRGEAAQFARALRPYLEDFQKLRPAGRAAWRGKVVGAALRTRGTQVTFALAPGIGLARHVATRA
jgi:hypothetical protein